MAIARLDPARVACIPNALAPAPPDSGEPPHPWLGAARPRGPVFVAVSRLEPVKNLPLLLDAFALVAPEIDARLLIVGSGSQEAALRARIGAPGLDGRAALVGHVASPRPYLRAADAFVLASDEEGFGQVLIEAMAEGLPVISTDAAGGGVRFVLDEGRAGILVPRRDPAALAAAMRDLAALELRARYRALSRARVEHFRPKAVGADLLAFIHSLPARA